MQQLQCKVNLCTKTNYTDDHCALAAKSPIGRRSHVPAVLSVSPGAPWAIFPLLIPQKLPCGPAMVVRLSPGRTERLGREIQLWARPFRSLLLLIPPCPSQRLSLSWPSWPLQYSPDVSAFSSALCPGLQSSWPVSTTTAHWQWRGVWEPIWPSWGNRRGLWQPTPPRTPPSLARRSWSTVFSTCQRRIQAVIIH